MTKDELLSILERRYFIARIRAKSATADNFGIAVKCWRRMWRAAAQLRMVKRILDIPL
jgi:hypothetical protein